MTHLNELHEAQLIQLDEALCCKSTSTFLQSVPENVYE